jgi:hypothetical protein
VVVAVRLRVSARGPPRVEARGYRQSVNPQHCTLYGTGLSTSEGLNALQVEASNVNLMGTEHHATRMLKRES